MTHLSACLRAIDSAGPGLFRIATALALTLLPFAAGAAWAAPPGTPAAQTPGAAARTDVVLVFAVDMSASVDEEEAVFQREAYALALENPIIMSIATSGPQRSVALGYMEWSGPHAQVMHVPMHVLRAPDDFRQMAARIRALGSSRGQAAILGSRTAVGAALVAAQREIEQSGFEAPSRIIDISGDGANNAGVTPTRARDRAVAAGITINALPIATSPRHSAELETFYRNHVIGGAGAFAMTALGFEDVADTLLMKMRLEFVRGIEAGTRHAAKTPPASVRAAALRPARPLPAR